jgi:hypothetical protein
MTVFIEQVAVELAVTLSVGAVFGFVSGLLSMPEHADQTHRRQSCRRCGSVVGAEPWPDRDDDGRRL